MSRPNRRLLALILLVYLPSCARRTPEATVRDAGVPSVASSAPRADAPTPMTGFRLVAELDYPIHFGALGSEALLIGGDRLQQVPIAVLGAALELRSDLARVNDPASPHSFVSAVAGTWPGDAWMALSTSSDAGPSTADVYRWEPNKGWIKRYEHDAGVADLVRWRENVVLVGSAFAVPVMIDHQLHELSASGLKHLGATGCSSDGSSLLAPSWGDGGALHTFGYQCGPHAGWPQGEGALIITTWSSAGGKTQRRLPLPGDLRVDQVVVDGKGPLVLLAELPKAPRLARFEQGTWVTVAELPPKLERLAAPGTHELWGVAGGRLHAWQGSGWATLALPDDARYAKVAWHSVWRRGPDNVWLIAEGKPEDGSTSKWLLFSTSDARAAGPVPSDAQRIALGESMTRDPEDCPEPFANFIQRRAFEPAAESQPPELGDGAARGRLATALKKHPELRHLKFLSHGCHGGRCIGAQVKDRSEAEALRAALPADRYARDDVRCVAPPVSTPFAVPL